MNTEERIADAADIATKLAELSERALQHRPFWRSFTRLFNSPTKEVCEMRRAELIEDIDSEYRRIELIESAKAKLSPEEASAIGLIFSPLDERPIGT